MVKYQIQIKPIHSVTNKPITGREKDKQLKGVEKETVHDYDLFLYWKRTSFNGNVGIEHIGSIPYECWAVYCEVGSIKQAMVIAKPLIAKYGTDNVQICKIAPSDIKVVFEE